MFNISFLLQSFVSNVLYLIFPSLLAFKTCYVCLCPNLSFCLLWKHLIMLQTSSYWNEENMCLNLEIVNVTLPWCPQRPATPGSASSRPLAWAAHFPCAAVQSVRISRIRSTFEDGTIKAFNPLATPNDIIYNNVLTKARFKYPRA